jgi:hypothetical protein
MAKTGLVEAVLWRAQQMRETLLRVGGVGVAAWVLVSWNFGMGLYLLVGDVALFGPPAESSEIPSIWARLLWNGFTGKADVTLLAVALFLLLSLRRNDTIALWWASAASASLWGALLVFLWVAYFSNGGLFVPTHLLGFLPAMLGAFLCLRLSAESESAGVPLTVAALLGHGEHRCGGGGRRRDDAWRANG